MATIQNQSPYVISSDSETEDSGLGKGIKKAGKASKREPIVFVRSLSSSSESSDEGTSVQKQATVSQSPDRNCSICLQQFQNKAFTDNCFHSFCYACIKEWSKVKATCPLCKTEFQSIIHTVKSIDDYQQDYLLPLGSAAFGNIDGQRFRYRTTLSLGRRMITETRRRIDEQMAIFQSYARHERIHSGRFRPDSRLSAISVRKSVYSRGLRARGVQGDQGRSRDISAEFFRSNPAVTHRLVPWLSRELEALVASRDIVEFLLQLILTIIQQVDLGSATIKQTLEPYLLHRTDHFLHEFMTFAKYPFDMNAFDRNVVYESPIFGDVSPMLAPLTPPELHRVAPAPYVPYASGITDIPTSYLNWAPRHSAWDSPTITPGPQPGRSTTGRSVTSMSGWDDETPGPSGLTSDPSGLTSDPSRLTSDPAGLTSGPEIAAPPPIATVKEEVPEPHSPASTSSGDSVIFAGYVKPLHERTPDAFVSLSSGSEDEAPEDNENTTPPKPSPRRRDRSRSRSRRSRSRSRRSRSRSRRSRSRSRSREGRYKNFSRSSRSRSRGRRSRSSSRGQVQRSRPRDRSKGRYKRSRSRSRRRSHSRSQRSRSRSRRRSHSRSRSRSFSRSRERERLLNKPGGKRKQKTRHLEGSPATSYRGSHRGSAVASEQRGSSYPSRQPAVVRSKDRGHGISRSRPYRSRSRERSWRSTSKDRSKAKERSRRSRDRSPVSRERSRHRYRGRTHRSRSPDRRSRSPDTTQQAYRADTQSSRSGDGQNSLARYSGTFMNQETEGNHDGRRRSRSRSSSLEVTYEGRKKHSSSHRKHDNDSDVEVTYCKMSSKDSRTSRHHHHKGKRKRKHKKKSKKHKRSKDKEKSPEKRIAEFSSTDEESSVGDVECLSTVSVSEKGDATDTERHDQTVSVIDYDSRGCNETKDIREHQYRQKGGNEDCEGNMSFEEVWENELDHSGTDNDEISRHRTSRVDKKAPKRPNSSNGTTGVKDTSKSLLDSSERRVIGRSLEWELTSQEGQLQQEMMSQEGMLEQEVTSQEDRLQQSIDETHVSASGSRRIVLAPKRLDRRIVISKNDEDKS